MNSPAPLGARRSRGILLLLMSALCALPLYAQDSHYWNIAYGTQATLLGGAVIGSASDLSATYYNPGLLALQKAGGLLVGANVYKYQRFSVVGDDDRESEQSTIAAAPGMIAGRIPIDSTILGGIAYSIMGRQYLSADITTRFTGTSDVYGSPPVTQRVSTELAFGTRLNETWVGISLFRLFPPDLGIGVTNYVAVRNQDIRSSLVGGVIPEGGELTTATRISDLSYYHVRLLWKLGVALELGDFSLGASVTTPSVGIMGSGSSYLHLAFSGQEGLADTSRTDVLVGSNQEDLESQFASSWALGLGAAYRFDGLRLHFSAEYFAPVAPFDLLSPAPFTGQSDGAVYINPIVFEMASVLNLGFGLELAVSPSTSLYGSVTSDISGISQGSANTVATTAWDLYHVTAGASFAFKALDLTVGISYAGGEEYLREIPWTGRLSDQNSLFQLTKDSMIRSTSLTGILALAFRL